MYNELHCCFLKLCLLLIWKSPAQRFSPVPNSRHRVPHFEKCDAISMDEICHHDVTKRPESHRFSFFNHGGQQGAGGVRIRVRLPALLEHDDVAGCVRVGRCETTTACHDVEGDGSECFVKEYVEDWINSKSYVSHDNLKDSGCSVCCLDVVW